MPGQLKQNQQFFMGLDIGSTTIKVVIMNEWDNIVYKYYQRHFSDIKASIIDIIDRTYKDMGDIELKVFITGSGGLALSQSLDLPFVQEVIACTQAVQELIPETDVAIELGGEDAKITYFGKNMEQRMNGTCAGGTGAFIDQMASLLQTDATGLNKLAEAYHVVYPIASRCGVFAKTDVQPLLNEGAAKEDIAVSILQAVVTQTISGLACGRPIRGKVAFLGGPLNFLPQLRSRFIETLNLTKEDIIFPENTQLFVAIGAAYLAKIKAEAKETNLKDIYEKVETLKSRIAESEDILRPLFKNEEELVAFRSRHNKTKAQCKDLSQAKGPVFLGIDAGSTTSKAVLVDEEGALLTSFYSNNNGDPLMLCAQIVKDFYGQLPSDAYIAKATVTGYGEALVKAGLNIDLGEVETMAHYKAAEHFLPGVDFILDIGGQDMKAIRIKDEAIESILLNEACSSGCGSFLETFAKSLQMPIETFAKEALKSAQPIDLGNRCTVFMNSKVKQAQKEGASVTDIAAGLSYSVIKNALHKVIKLRRPEDFGEKILAQGGTFYNEAVLRAFELEVGREVVRPDIAGLMGAYGAALLAKEQWQPGKLSTILTPEQLKNFKFEQSSKKCDQCTNNCQLAITTFANGNQYISGNRCERGAGLLTTKKELPDLFEYKYKRIFAYKPLTAEQATRGQVGIPRVLNMYENYPFWHTFFTRLGFQVVLSPRSNKAVFEEGMESIPSEAVCYPAKLVHGHIMHLIKRKVKFIFYPCVTYEKQEDENSTNKYNCPVVTGYPEVIKNNMDEVRESGIIYKDPFISFDDFKSLENTLYEEIKEFGVSKKAVKEACEMAWIEQLKVRADIRKKGEETLEYLTKNKLRGVVLCGRPYHIDPEINHGLTKIITGEGMAVLTEDSVAHLGKIERPLRIFDQWVYHRRLYAAASFVATRDDLELVQITSFGCGLDAITADQTQDILRAKNKLYMLIKIDEGSNLGAIRIRIRSLKATVQRRAKQMLDKLKPALVSAAYQAVEYTQEMQDAAYTLLSPQLSPIHFDFLAPAFRSFGYNIEILPKADKQAVDEGLRSVNNDACYPCVMVTGQIMQAVKSGKYDLSRTAVFITQTGGPCRATNYASFIRKGLNDAGYDNIPVIPLSIQGFEKHSGFKITIPMFKKALMAIIYGDLFMKLVYSIRPYEVIPGSTNALHERWKERCINNVATGSLRQMKRNVNQIVKEFDRLEIKNIKKPKVGLVGEILVKYQPDANNNALDVVEAEGGEAVVPGMLDFFNYCSYNNIYRYEHLGFSKKGAIKSRIVVKLFEWLRSPVNAALSKSKRFKSYESIFNIAKKAKKVIQLGNFSGEGWLLTGEMVELIEEGIENIICMQPFACLPNHITGRGVIKELRRRYPASNIVAVDYDPGASETNQLNRIKLMMAIAHKNLEEGNMSNQHLKKKNKNKYNVSYRSVQ